MAKWLHNDSIGLLVNTDQVMEIQAGAHNGQPAIVIVLDAERRHVIPFGSIAARDAKWAALKSALESQAI